MLGYGSWREAPLPSSEPPFQAQPASPPTAQLRGEAVSRWPGPLGPLGSAGPRGPALRGAQAPLLPNAPPGRCRPGPRGRPRRGWGAAGPADQSHCVRIVLPFWPATWHKGGGRVCTWHCPGLFSEGQPRTPETPLGSGTSLRTATPGSDGQRESSRPRSPGPPPPARIPGWPPRAGAAPRAPGPAGAKRRLRALPRPPHAPLLARAAPSWAVGPSGARPRG